MSSLCTITSPSQVVAGPGGCFTEVTTASKPASVSAGVAPRRAATPFSCSLSKLNPEAIRPAKNAGGVSVPAEVMWASTSRTVQSPHSEGVAQSSSPSARRSAARALRSAWTAGQISVPMSPPHRSRPRPAASCCSVRAKLAVARASDPDGPMPARPARPKRRDPG